MYWDKEYEGGFDFSKVVRNKALSAKGLNHTFTKTGTTIVGVVFDKGVVLGADTRATAGDLIADPDCIKIHDLAPNIYAAGAGTAADLEYVKLMMRSELEMQRLYTGSESRLSHVESRLTHHLFRYQGHVGAAIIVGGVDVKGPQLVTINPHGNSMRLPFTTMGSGSLAAMGVLETKYRDNLTQEEAIELVKDAIEAGIFNDLFSGSNVNITIIKRTGAEYLKHYRVYDKKYFEPSDFKFKKGTTQVIEEIQKKWKNVEVKEEESVPMDIC